LASGIPGAFDPPGTGASARSPFTEQAPEAVPLRQGAEKRSAKASGPGFRPARGFSPVFSGFFPPSGGRCREKPGAGG